MSIAPIAPIDQPAPAPARVSIGMELLFALAAAVVVAGLGAPVGLLWSRIAPQVELVQTQYGPYPIDGEPEGYWADDGWFIILALAMGVLVAIAAWLLLRRYRGPVMLVGLVLGSVGASVLAAWLGNKIGYAHYLDLVEHAPVDTHIFRPVKLRTGTSNLPFGFLPRVRGTLLIQALAAAAVYTGLAGFHASPTLRYETMPAEYLDPEPEPPQPPGAWGAQSSNGWGQPGPDAPPHASNGWGSPGPGGSSQPSGGSGAAGEDVSSQSSSGWGSPGPDGPSQSSGGWGSPGEPRP